MKNSQSHELAIVTLGQLVARIFLPYPNSVVLKLQSKYLCYGNVSGSARVHKSHVKKSLGC